MTGDVERLTDGQLELRRALIKLEINNGYLKNPDHELKRFNRLSAEYDMVLTEINRRRL